ncbi:hypothetical protein LLB_3451 [Legionella longbeachae D-4968]|nr:hypothetical protein LLB_3451 [Legionella longbeachae D-4968]
MQFKHVTQDQALNFEWVAMQNSSPDPIHAHTENMHYENRNCGPTRSLLL